MRKALFIGINEYESIQDLKGCEDDAISMSEVLSRHSDGRPNFGAKVNKLPSETGNTRIT
nr:Uncharacterised protein [Escherichia coli]